MHDNVGGADDKMAQTCSKLKLHPGFTPELDLCMRSLIFFTLFTEKENTPARITFSILVCRIFSMILACMNIVRLKFTHEKSHARTCERAVGVSFRA